MKDNSAIITHSLKKRYAFKLVMNISGIFISFLSQTIVMRGLGPASYGKFSFLSNFFNNIVSFFEMGTSQAFYSKISYRQKERSLTTFYAYFGAGIVLLTIILVFAIDMLGMDNILWPEQTALYIYLATFLSIFNWFLTIVSQMADAYGLTIRAEIWKVLQRIFCLGVIFILLLFNAINLFSFFIYNYISVFSLIIIFVHIIRSSGDYLPQNWTLTYVETKRYAKEFYSYSRPIFIYSLIGMIVAILDRWLLQLFGGNIEQGFFGLSYQIGAVCFLFSSAMTPLIMREFSIAYGTKDLNMMAHLFRRYIPLLYSVTAFLACFTAVNADKIAMIIGGARFNGATLAIAIMAIYPIHQTYGQLSNSVFLATGRTALYCNIGILFMVAGLPLTYLLIAPKSMFGMNAGAFGLAIKMVLIQFFAVNTQFYFNSKFLKLSFWKYFSHQVVNILLSLITALVAGLIVHVLLGNRLNVIISLGAAGILYVIFSALLVYCLPITFGLKRNDIERLLARFC